MKSTVRSMVPPWVLEQYRRARRVNQQRKNRRLSTEEVFTRIYQENRWGGRPGEFSSGFGTRDSRLASAYTAMIARAAATERFAGSRFVDLGCGDFHVGRTLLPLCSSYIGVDIVEPLIRRNQAVYGSATTRFTHLDIAIDRLPCGDVCFVRQVLQHLSNQQIATVLGKLEAYRSVFITEHYPTDNDAIRPNVDKVHGGDVRVDDNSGVYLSQPPFSIPARALRLMLEVPVVGLGAHPDAGVLRTYLYRPDHR